jgi:hypothetical protein
MSRSNLAQSPTEKHKHVSANVWTQTKRNKKANSKIEYPTTSRVLDKTQTPLKTCKMSLESNQKVVVV